MPWASEDAPRHTHLARTPRQRRQWAAVANGERERLIAAGVSEEEAESRAIRAADAVLRDNHWG